MDSAKHKDKDILCALQWIRRSHPAQYGADL